jgi:hypothetical protein
MSVPTCFEKTRSFLKERGWEISIHDLREMSIALSERKAEVLAPSDFQALVTQLYSDKLEELATARRAARTLQLQKVQQASDVVSQKIPGQSIVKNLESWILGNSRRIGDAMNIGVGEIKKALTSQWLRAVRSTLNDVKGDLKIAESGLLSREVTQEMAALERGEMKSASGNEQAFRIAKAYQGVMAQVFETKQAFDPFLGRIQDYFFRATHDRVKISAVEKPEWVQFAMSKYGQKSFPEMSFEQKAEQFARIYDQIKRGVYESSLELEAESGDIMRKLAKNRSLIPNDWESFHEYNQKFGRLNVHTTVLRSLETAAHDLAVIQKFGANPTDTFNGVMRNALKSAENPDELKASRERLAGYFNAAIAPAQAPATGGYARFMRGFMAIETLAKNGSAFLRSWSDLANFTRRISDDIGGNYLGNFAEAAGTYLNHFASSLESRQAAMEDMFLYSRSALHNLYQELGGSSGVTGTTGPVSKGLNSLLEMQSWVSLMDRHITSVDAAMATVVSRRLGQLSTLEYAALPKEARAGMLRYGLKEAEWKLLQKGVESWEGMPGMEKAAGDVSRMINVDSIQAIPRETISQYLIESGQWKGAVVPNEAVIRARTELASKVGAMVNQHADAASSTAGLSEKLWMYGNTLPGTFSGETLRLLGQFKSAMVKNYDTLVRSKYSNPEKLQGDWTKVVQHVILGSGLWMMGDVAKSVFEGNTPEDPSKPSVIARALFASGAAGLIGDSILSESTRHTNSYDIAQGIVKGLAGPVINTSADVAGMLTQFGVHEVQGTEKSPGASLGRLITGNLPFQNLFYTKGAFNYYFANGIKEWLAPGYMGRMNRNLRQRGQSQLDVPIVAPAGSAF